MTNIKKKKERDLFEYEEKMEIIAQKVNYLEKLNKVINWEMFRDLLNRALAKKSKGPGGASHYDYVFMFKILVIQRFYGMSDEQTEYQIHDRLSFQKFLGITLSDSVPDQNTIREFRENLTSSDAMKKLFRKFDRHLETMEIVGTEGVIVDATFVDVPKQRNSREDNDKLKKNEIPEAWKKNPHIARHKDMDARWTKKNDETHYGYKNHIKIGKISKIIRSCHTTPANVHDSQALDDLLQKRDSGQRLWGDSAYTGQTRIFSKFGVKPQINEKGYRGHQLTKSQKERNRRKSKVRVLVEHVFGFMENSMGGMFLRTLGRERAETSNILNNLVYNFCRYAQITA
jgi:IS5 family transposase